MHFALFKFALVATAGVIVRGGIVPSEVSRPPLVVPTLIEIRDILSRIEAPIVSTLVQRVSLPSNPGLYTGAAPTLLGHLSAREQDGLRSGRYDYGTLEYPFTLPPVVPDRTTQARPFPPGQFHQDSFIANTNLTAFYLRTLTPLFTSPPASTYFHLSAPPTPDEDAVLDLDTTLLQLLSHRTHIGKIVAEAKYAANVTQYASLIKAGDSAAILVLLTDAAQVAAVLTQADNAATVLARSWVAAGQVTEANFESDLRAATETVFRELIDITTQVELEYLLQRLE
ncbi:chorismate mutase [Infundibulicybe gibba]|nr:chorismate mutase [Infundibulicybe gibba]